MDTVCKLIACAFGQFAAYCYFSRRFETKCPIAAVCGFFAAALAVQFAVSFAGLAALNIALLFISNLCAAFIIYRAGIKQSLIHCLLLEVLAAMSAFIIMFGLPKIIGHEPPGNGMILLGISSSALYFTFSYAVSRHKDDMIVYSVLVSMLSLVCAAMIAGFAFFPGSNLVLTLISVILPLAISAVCMAYRKLACKISNSTETLSKTAAEAERGILCGA